MKEWTKTLGDPDKINRTGVFEMFLNQMRASVTHITAAVLGLTWRARATPAGAFAVGVTASAVVYVLTFFAVGVAADFRYAYWCVLATLAGAVAAVMARRSGGRAA